MLLKSADPLERYLVELVQDQGLLGSFEHAYAARTTVHQQASVMAFHEFAGYLNEAFGLDKDFVVAHDLRMQSEVGRAHIDHLIISRSLDVFVIESRLAGDVLIVNDEEEFSARYRDGAVFHIRSPITQLRRGAVVLQHLFRRIELPSRFGATLIPKFHRLILVPESMTLSNRSAVAPEMFVKPKELLRRVIGTGRASPLSAFLFAATSDQLRDVGRIVVRWHTPERVDFIAKYRAHPIDAVDTDPA